MVTKKKTRTKHVPQRTCIGCREVLAKRVLIRIVRQESGIVIDPSGKLAGRGAYLHNRRSCWVRGLKGALAQALRTALTTEDIARLTEYANSMPEDEINSQEPENDLAAAANQASKLTG